MRYYEKSDYPMIAAWCSKRDMPCPDIGSLPSMGMIADGIAAGFLVQTDTDTAIIDFLLSNPRADLMARGRALNLIIELLISQAKALGFKRIKCDSTIMSVKRKAVRLGFRYLGEYTAFSRRDSHG